jgi:hypothetical protein
MSNSTSTPSTSITSTESAYVAAAAAVNAMDMGDDAAVKALEALEAAAKAAAKAAADVAAKSAEGDVAAAVAKASPANSDAVAALESAVASLESAISAQSAANCEAASAAEAAVASLNAVISARTASSSMPEVELDEDGNVKVAKVTHPLSLLPASAMSLDEVKRKYYEHRKAGTRYFSADFKDGFDANGFSLYKSVHKYSSDFDGRLDFINNNAVNGFAQNMDDSKSKYTFGTLLLLDKDGKKQVTGYWLLRGDKPSNDVFTSFVEDNDWQKLDLTDDVLKQFDNAFYTADKIDDDTEMFEGFTVEHRKIVL